jgi:hypothetical protein
VKLATKWQNRANALQTRQEKTRHAKLSRLNRYLADLKNPAIEYVSVKISTLFSQINPLAPFDTKLETDANWKRMVASNFCTTTGSKVSVIIIIDMGIWGRGQI